MAEVTRILDALGPGDPHAAEQLLPLVYDELRQLAAQRLAQEKPGQTLQATALVHEAYLRLVGADQAAATGTAAATSSPPPPRPCGGSSSRTPAASASRKHGGGRRAGSSQADLQRPTRAGRRPAGPGRGPEAARPASQPGRPSWSSSAIFAGLHHRAGGRGPGHLAADRRPPLGLTPAAGRTSS